MSIDARTSAQTPSVHFSVALIYLKSRYTYWIIIDRGKRAKLIT